MSREEIGALARQAAGWHERAGAALAAAERGSEEWQAFELLNRALVSVRKSVDKVIVARAYAQVRS